jgi:signal peptidase I
MPKDKAAANKKPYTVGRFLRDVVEVVVPAVILYLLISTFFLQSREVPTASMVPTIAEHDRFLLEKTAYWFNKPKRFDIIVLKPPPAAGSNIPFVKRVIGLPGETIQISKGMVYINHRPIKEPFISADRAPNYDFGPFIIPDDQIIVLGDNRNKSFDSHYWGPLPFKYVDHVWWWPWPLLRNSVQGRAWWRYWPVSRMGLVK